MVETVAAHNVRCQEGLTVNPDEVAAEGVAIHAIAATQGVPVRLLGSLAIALRCPGSRPLMAMLGRRPAQDIDLMAYTRDESALESIIAARGYELHPSVRHSREWGVKRLIYTHPQHGGKVDVFLDQLVMAQTIDFLGRLESSDLTVALADLLLSKLQIHRITNNDLIDLIALLAEHDLSAEPDGIDVHRLTSVLGDDWGFSFGARRNLEHLKEDVAGRPALDAAIVERVQDRATRLIDVIDQAPKSTRWRLRARLGTRRAWYQHVDDVDV